MPLQATSGAASYDGFGGGAAAVPNYIEDVFSTYLYTGNGSTGQTITNGIDLSTKGGLVWGKSRLNAPTDNSLVDTVRGNESIIYSNLTQAADTPIANTISFLSTGFSVKNNIYNANGQTYASWTFRKQPKFFDVVTYTGTGSGTQTIAHNLGSVPGCIIVKSTSQSSSNWRVYHRSLGVDSFALLNLTNAALGYNGGFSDITSTSFGVADSNNGNGQTFVAYLFAHDAGGFGLTGTDNVISCGSFTYVSGTLSVNLGYEPQWVMIKQTNGSGSWFINDNMRNWRVDNGSSAGTGTLYAQSSNAEGTGGADWNITSTGFNVTSGTGTFIYIAIRRGPMKVPTLGTSVFDVDTLTPAANLTGTKVTNPFATDLLITTQRDHAGLPSTYAVDRLRGGSVSVATNSTGAEQDWGTTYSWKFDYNDGFLDNFAYPQGTVTTPMIYWSFKRAPGFFDEVCYTGNYAGNPQVPHNLGVAPEMLIARSRVSVGQWYVKHIGMSDTEEVYFNAGALSAGPTWVRTSTYWQYSSAQYPNDAHVAYLFATCAGVSKVGSYTGTATTKQIDCGFTAGARFVLIKRTDSTGDWYVWDSARGIVAGNDPYLLLNSTAAEVTSTDYVDTYSAGFEISSTAPAAINASGGTFIFLAIS